MFFPRTAPAFAVRLPSFTSLRFLPDNIITLLNLYKSHNDDLREC